MTTMQSEDADGPRHQTTGGIPHRGTAEPYGVDISILSGAFRQCSSVRSGMMRSYLVTLAENAPESVSQAGIPNLAITRRSPRILGHLVAVHFSTVDLNRKKTLPNKILW